MDTTRLRTLTKKSKMKFGRYETLTVRELIDVLGFKGQRYLAWVYYSANQISFMDEILSQLGILPENRIEKPGNVKKEYLREYLKKATDIRNMQFAKLNREDQERIIKDNVIQNNYSKKQKKFQNEWNDKRVSSKISNMNATQGKSYGRCKNSNGI